MGSLRIRIPFGDTVHFLVWACCIRFGVKPHTKDGFLRPCGIAGRRAALGPGVLPPCLISLLGTLPTPCGVCRLVISTVADEVPGPGAVHKSAPKHALTRTLTLRPEGSSLQAETGRSEQGVDRGRAREPRFDTPTLFLHRTHGLRRTCSSMLAASSRSRRGGRLVLSRLAHKSSTSGYHARMPE